MSTRTVEAHRAAIMSKVGVSSVAELVRATAVALDSNDSLNMMCRIYPGLVSFWDNGLVAKFANERHETSFGMKLDAILGKSLDEFLGASCYRRSMPFIQAVLAGKTQSFTQRLPMPVGRPLVFSTVYSPQFDALGDVVGFFAFMVETKALPIDVRMTVGGATETAWAEMILDEENRIVSVNDAFTDITQFKTDEVRGQTPIMIRPPGIEPSAFMEFWAGIMAERQWQGTVWYRRRDGYLFRSRQEVTGDGELRGQRNRRVKFHEIKIP